MSLPLSSRDSSPEVMGPERCDAPLPTSAPGIFRDFSFDAPPNRPPPLQTNNISRKHSPASSPVPSQHYDDGVCGEHRLSVTELSHQLSEQHIRPENFMHDSTCCGLPPASSSEAIEVDPPSPCSSPPPQQHPAEGAKAKADRQARSAVRQVRQKTSRLQCSAVHKRELSSLVRRMLEDEDQCVVRVTATATAESKAPIIGEAKQALKPSSSSTAAAAYGAMDLEGDSDENGWQDEATTLRDILKYRRSGELAHGSACVNKIVRMRRKPKRMART